MNSKNKVIIVLVVIALIATLIMQFVVLPRIEQNKKEYLKNQQNPTKHSLKSILKYQNKYMGNASNISQLYNNLPLSTISNSLKLNSDELTAEVYYKENTGAIDKTLLKQALIYNATASFALIDNLQKVKYVFTGNTYSITREIVEFWYDTDNLNSLLTEEKWKNKVQKDFNDNDIVGTMFLDFTEGE